MNPIKVIQANQDWAVCVKPVGMDSEKEIPQVLKEQLGGSFLPVHRLDLNVGGIMIYARNSMTAGELSRQMQEKSFQKEYLAEVHGRLPEAGRMEDLLWKDSAKRKVFAVKRMRQGVKRAALNYETVCYDEQRDLSLVRIRLETGRTHQIRVQFSSRGFPLRGDHKYGARDSEKAPRLFSASLSFLWKGKPVRFSETPDWEWS